MRRTNVAVTGASGLLGQRLLPLLASDEQIERVVGLDVRDPARRVRGLEFHRVDIAGAELEPLVDGVDVVVHLASLRDPLPDDALMRRVNVGGTRRLLDAAARTGVSKVVRVSSAAAYGAWPNNPVPLTEDAPLRPNPGYAPALHDAECERLLGEWHERHPDAVTTVLRCAPVVGPGALSLLARVAVGRPPVGVRDAARPVQVLHVDDAAGALAAAVRHDLDGAFNVAADSWLPAEEAWSLLERRRMPGLPYEAAERTLAALWASGLGDAPASVLPFLVHPWVVSNDRMRATGWAPRHTNEEAILLAGPDTRRSRVGWWALAGAAAAGAAAAGWVLRRRLSG